MATALVAGLLGTVVLVGPGGPAGASACTPPTTSPFLDVDESHPFCAEIVAAYSAGYIGGYYDSTFRPANEITRQAVAAMLARLLVGTTPLAPCTAAAAADVPASHSFCPYISLLYTEGIMGGYPDGSFRPSANITRQAVAASMARVLHQGEAIPPCASTAPFPDVPLDHPFCAEIQAVATAGITTGYGDGTFQPGRTITRQGFAAMLMRLATALD